MFNFNRKLAISMATCMVALFSQTKVKACTGIQLQTKNGAFVSGRTLEFGIDFQVDIIAVPKGHKFTGSTSLGAGKTWTAKYNSVGAMLAGNPLILDGINEKGLSVGNFYFPTYAEYSVTTKDNQNISLSSSDFTQWIVSQFATVDEVRKAIESGSVAISPVKTPGFPPAIQPFHFVVYDRSGKCLVIEPIKGKLLLYDNPTGTLTNSPNFGWHMTNLRNYISLDPNNKPTKMAFNTEFKPLGQGSGMMGLPGEFTPPARFVRAAVFSATAIPETNADRGIKQVFHILNNFDIPVGIAREVHEGKIYSDFSMFTCARDAKNARFFYKTYEDQTIRMVDLKLVNFKDSSKTLKVSAKNTQSFVDESQNLK